MSWSPTGMTIASEPRPAEAHVAAPVLPDDGRRRRPCADSGLVARMRIVYGRTCLPSSARISASVGPSGRASAHASPRAQSGGQDGPAVSPVVQVGEHAHAGRSTPQEKRRDSSPQGCLVFAVGVPVGGEEHPVVVEVELGRVDASGRSDAGLVEHGAARRQGRDEDPCVRGRWRGWGRRRGTPRRTGRRSPSRVGRRDVRSRVQEGPDVRVERFPGGGERRNAFHVADGDLGTR